MLRLPGHVTEWSSGRGPAAPVTDGRSVPTAAPRAQRMRGRWMRDWRLWLGMVLLVASMFIGAWLVSAPDGSTMVWRAARDLPVGATPEVVAVPVALGSVAADYWLADTPVTGRMVLPVSAGALLPKAAVGPVASGSQRLVTIPVDPLHAPVPLDVGDTVELWVTPEDGGIPELVLRQAVVAEVASDRMGIGGELGVVLQVSPTDAAAVVAAGRSGAIDLVAVPLAASTVAGP